MTLPKCRRLITLTPVVALTLVPVAGLLAGADATIVQVRGGTAVFDAATNLPAISVHGKSEALEGRATIRPGAAGLTIERLEATVPVQTLDTGMALRDEHMQKHVFTTADGKLPDLHFESEKATCSGSEAQSTCQLTGELSIRGTARPFAIELKVTKAGSAFRAVGSGIVKLSSYGIPQPSQLGVKTQDDVRLRLDFVAKPSSDLAAAGGAK
jgi:polyisoprenoid-binding protein YceI